jgi:hypothetical protein
MNAELLVLLLEERIIDIKQNLEAGLWQGFVGTLAQAADEIQPRKDALERWADKVCDLLMGCSYTKGLLQGLQFLAAMPQRSLPSRMPCPDGGSSTGMGDATARAGEGALVARIKAVVHKAQTLS